MRAFVPLAGISGGFVSVTQDGIARIIAQVGAAADTVVLRVQQTAGTVVVH